MLLILLIVAVVKFVILFSILLFRIISVSRNLNHVIIPTANTKDGFESDSEDKN